MSPIDIMLFLLPHDFFQWCFLIIISGFAGWNIWSVKSKANSLGWENNWNNGTKEDDQDDLDSEHGSVIEISQAVATKAEKLAEIMPGLLLVIGLLGTFLGLGLALNKASEILSHANTAGMDMAMEEMMKMMEGLGTKFKTSTWGIIGFLSFKAWTSVNNFEDRRLRWTIKRMKVETDDRRRAKKAFEDRHHEEIKKAEKEQYDLLIKTILQGNENICNALNSTLPELNETNKKNLAESTLIHKAVKDVIKTLHTQNGHFTSLEGGIKEMSSNTLSMKNSVVEFIDANIKSIEVMQISGQQMAEAASKIGSSAKELDKAIGQFQKKVSDVLDDIRNNLGSTIKDMNNDFTKNLTNVAKQLGEATKSISDAVKLMSKGIQGTLDHVGGSISTAIDVQKKAFSLFQTTSDTLNENIQQVTGNLDKVMSAISQGLSAVSDKRQEMVQASNGIKYAAESVKNSNEIIRKIVGSIETMKGGIESIKGVSPQIHGALLKSNDHLSNLDKKFKDLNTLLEERS